MDAPLLDALEAHSGLVCLVGAGGKKTTLYRLAAEHPGRVGVTCTVHIPPFPKSLEAEVVIDEPAALRAAVTAAAGRARVVAFARPSEKRGRLAGLPAELVAPLHTEAGFDLTVVKADGARSRWLKAPERDEPQLPEGVGTGVAGTVIPVVSVRALGEPLSDRVAHRVERVAAVTGLSPGEPITPVHLGRLLASPDGALKGTGEAVVVPLINMVEDDERLRLAREAARAALAATDRFDRVVLAAMRSTPALVEVVTR